MKLLTLDVNKLKQTAKKPGGGAYSRARKKLAILERDGFKCVTCGTTDNLTIAHIVPPKRKRGRNASSFVLKDCKTQCAECHVKEEHKN